MKAYAAAAVGALGSCSGPVEVVGTDPLADEVRQRLTERGWPADSGQRPGAIIETTGDAAALIAALERVADLGTVVIAGPPPDRPMPLDLYPELHVRGLTVVGVSPDQA